MYSTFQSHEPEFDYLKSLEIEEKINKIRWLKRKNPAHFLLSTNGNIFVFTNSFGVHFPLCRQNDQAVESEREGQEGGGIQPEGGQRSAEGPEQHHQPPGARPQAHGADGGGQSAEDIRQCSHLSHQLHLSQLRPGQAWGKSWSVFNNCKV